MRPPRTIAVTLLALIAVSPTAAVSKQKSSETIWHERIEAGCKSDARKYYSAIFPEAPGVREALRRKSVPIGARLSCSGNRFFAD